MKEPAVPTRGAAEWFLAIESTEVPDTETLQAWLRWLESSEDNRRAFEEIAQVWHSTPSAVIARRTDASEREDYDGSISVAEWRTLRQSKEDVPVQVRSPARTIGVRQKSAGMFRTRSGIPVTWHRPVLAIAAAATFGAIAVLAYEQWIPSPIAAGEFVTRTAEHRVLRLADGSRVTLGGHSRLRVDLRSTIREIHLESGEAYFSVSKDRVRPFVVRALEGAITAIGTSFNVRAIEDRVTVTVTEGSVKVAADKPSPGGEDLDGEFGRLTRGEQLTYGSGVAAPIQKTVQIKRVDIAESARWRDGWFVYRDEPLKYVIADMTRYTDLKLQLDESAAHVQFSGAVSKDRIGEWIAALPEVAKVSVTRDAQGFTIAARVTP